MSTNTYAYNYDDIGNRLSSTSLVSSLSSVCNYSANALNQYTNISCSSSSTTQTPVYDSDGNMLSFNNWTFTWNAENRLVQASNATTVVTYAYDYQGRMFEKVTDGVKTSFVWNGNRIIREMKTSPTLSVVHSYIWGAEGTPLAMTDSTNTFFYCLDANKNVTELVDSNGSSVAHYEYSPFGVTTLSTGSLAQTNPFHFSSEYFDSTTDFIHYKYRIYLSQLARWLSRDPIEEEGGLNLYVFVGNDSINWWDEWGMRRKDAATRAEERAGSIEYSDGTIGPPRTEEERRQSMNSVRRLERYLSAKEIFLKWYKKAKKDMKWTETLSDCPCNLNTTTCTAVAVNMEGGFSYTVTKFIAPEGWELVGDPSEKNHPGGYYDLRRSEGGHGQQCVYDKEGQLITHGLGMGTADFSYPSWRNLWSDHVNNDVSPYDIALFLDGDPNHPNEKGEYYNKYIEVRPGNAGKDKKGNPCPKNP